MVLAGVLAPCFDGRSCGYLGSESLVAGERVGRRLAAVFAADIPKRTSSASQACSNRLPRVGDQEP